MADPARAMHMLGIQHEEMLGSEGTRLVLSASQTHTEPGLTLAPLELAAISKDLQLAVQHPFIRLRTESLTGRLTFDYRNTDTTTFGDTPLTSDRVRALQAGRQLHVRRPLPGNGPDRRAGQPRPQRVQPHRIG